MRERQRERKSVGKKSSQGREREKGRGGEKRDRGRVAAKEGLG